MVSVRRAVLSDVLFVNTELKDFAKFYATRLSLYPEDGVAIHVIMNLIENHLFLIAERELKPLGFIAGWVTPHPFNPDITVLTEAFWWVKPTHRSTTRAGSMLLDEFITWGKANCDWVTMTLEDQSPVSETTLTKRGFKLKERNFILESPKPGGA